VLKDGRGGVKLEKSLFMFCSLHCINFLHISVVFSVMTGHTEGKMACNVRFQRLEVVDFYHFLTFVCNTSRKREAGPTVFALHFSWLELLYHHQASRFLWQPKCAGH
jgi:hypothetical protein